MHYQRVDFQRIFDLTKWLEGVLKQEPIRFSATNFPFSLPAKAGIYFISDLSQDKEEIVYIGLTGNLQRRVYQNQLMGDTAASQIKVALVKYGRASDWNSAKDYLKNSCAVRFVEVTGYREREMHEGFAKAVLKPEFSLYKSKEH